MSDIIIEEDPLRMEGVNERQIVEEEESSGPSLAELQGLYEGERKKREELEGRIDPTAAFQRTLEGFKESLGQVAQRPVYVQPQQASQEEDMNALMDDFDKNFLDAPSKRIMKLNSKMLQGPLEGIVNSQFAMAKRLVQVESAEKDLFKQYEREIEGEFAKIPVQERAADPVGAYERSFSMVKGRHFEEIYASRAAGAQSNAPQAAQRPQNAAAGTERIAPSPLAKPQTSAGPEPIRIKAGQKERIYDAMRRDGVHESNFATYVEILNDRGQLASI